MTLPPSFLFFILSFLVSFGIYLRTLCPTLFVGESGIWTTASHTLGSLEFPGYPLFCLLGKLFTFLPFGNIAYRMNLFSAFFGALTVGFVYLILLHLLQLEEKPRASLPYYVACGGSLFYGFLRDVWREALHADRYTLHTFFVAVLLYLLLRWLKSPKEKTLFLFLFLFGLGLGNHPMLLMFGVLFLVLLGMERPPFLKEPSFWGKSLFFSLLGLSIYLYFPLRGLEGPLMKEGILPPLPRSLALYGEELSSFLVTWERQGPLFFWVFSLLGFRKLFSTHPKEWFCVTFLFLEATFFLILMTHFEVTPTETERMRPLYLTAWMLLVLLWGMGILFKRNLGVVMISFLFPFFLLWRHFPLNDLSRDRLAEDFGHDLLETLQPKGTLFIAEDKTVYATLAYLHVVEQKRPDLSLFGLDRPGPFPKASQKTLLQMLSETPGRPLYFNAKIFFPPELSSYGALATEGLLYRWKRRAPLEALSLTGRGEKVSPFSWASYRIQTPERYPAHDPKEKLLLARYFWMRGEGPSLFLDDDPLFLTELAKHYLFLGKTKEGAQTFQRALQKNPYDSEVWKGFGITLGQLGYYRESVQFLLRAFERRPWDADLSFNLGVSYGNGRHFEEALFWWRKTLLLDPSRTSVKDYIQKAEAISRSR